MTDKITYKLEGFKELEAQLKALGDGYRHDLVARNTLAKAGRVAMQPVYDMLVRMAPYDAIRNTSGIHLRDTARIDSRIPNNGDLMSAYVEKTDNIISIVSVKKSAVSLAQEFGTAKKPLGHPFLRISLESKATNVLSILKSQLGQIIPDYWKSLKRRGIK
jgi:hypothetical protein